MKGTLRYLSPFAMDASGGISVLYELGGMIIICDAGGCTGNICGFDEPRWFKQKSAIFSAGLRDMDAILGRDDLLVKKIQKAAKDMDVNFIALVSTPVPAVIATDFKGLSKMIEKKCGLPVLVLEALGTKHYQFGEEEAYEKLIKRFAPKEKPDLPADTHKTIGILGLTPLELSRVEVKEELTKYYQEKGYEQVFCYGMGDGIEAIRKINTVDRIVCISPAAVKAAKYLEKTYDIPYEINYPLLEKDVMEELASVEDLNEKKILIVHQQTAANELRKKIRSISRESKQKIVVGTWFFMRDEDKEDTDLMFKTEQEFQSYLRTEKFDLIIADRYMRRAVRDVDAQWIDYRHFAVSGKLPEEEYKKILKEQ